MATALESASLVMIPSGYEEGTLGSLQPLDGTGDFTFSRGSNLSATRVNQDGYIEKGYENLLLQSNQFDTTWTTSNASLTGGQAGYDGSNDAWVLEKTNSGGSISQSVSANNLTTFSVYAKAATNSWLRFNIVGKANVFINLSNGDIGQIQGTAGITATAINAGGGWYRCSFTYNTAITFQVSIIVADSDGSTSSPTGSIYIQDAQLNQGLAAYPYLETTTTSAKGGILENTPRIDYTGGGAGSLLLEPSRTNDIPQSEYIKAIGAVQNMTLLNNASVNPQGSQYATEAVPTANTATHLFFKGGMGNTANTFTQSIYAKANGYNFCFIRIDSPTNYAWFDLENGVVGQTQSGMTSTIEDAGNGWYRCTATLTTSNYANAVIGVSNQDGVTAFTANGTSSVLFWGWQSELGTYPTSYIPTYGTSQTRAEDTATNTDMINADNDFTLYFESNSLPADVGRYLSISGNLGYLSAYSGGRIRWRYNNSNLSSPIDEGVFKWLIRKDSTNIKMYVNGVVRYTIAALPSALQSFNLQEGCVYKTLLFPTALTDSACIELTTI